VLPAINISKCFICEIVVMCVDHVFLLILQKDDYDAEKEPKGDLKVSQIDSNDIVDGRLAFLVHFEII
jgi:hypothetical protein